MARILLVGRDGLLTRAWVRALWRANHEARAIRATGQDDELRRERWCFDLAIMQPEWSTAQPPESLDGLTLLAEPSSLVAVTQDVPAPVHGSAGCRMVTAARPDSDRDLLVLVDRCLAQVPDRRREAFTPPEPAMIGRQPSGVRRRYPSNPSEPPTTMRVLRVLVVDPDVAFANGCARVLSAAGCETVVATDGIDALALLLIEEFDLALCAVDLPRLAGPALMQELRGRGSKLPFVLMGDAQPRAEPGRTTLTFLRKPIATPSLLALVDDVRRQPRQARSG